MKRRGCRVWRKAKRNVRTNLARMQVSCGIFGTRRCGATRFAGSSLPLQCCWKCPWYLGVQPMGVRLQCEIRARTGEFRFHMEDLMGRQWSAAITDGDLTAAAGSALKFLL